MHQKAGLRGADYSDKAAADSPILVTNDGQTLARSVVLPDRFENMGALLVKEAASKVGDNAGDGTTTAIVLAREILREGLKNIAAGADPIQMQRGLLKACEAAMRMLRDSAVPADDRKTLTEVAAVSCGDKELGAMVADALMTVGLEGVINVDDLHRSETTLEILEGIVFDRGLIDPAMATEENTGTAELQNAYILLVKQTIAEPMDLVQALIIASEDDRPLLVIADDVQDKALGFLHQNRVEGDLKLAAVKSPEYGEGRDWRMEDLAIQTGGTYITENVTNTLRNLTRDMLGEAETIKITHKRTVIMGGRGDPQKIQDRINQLRWYAEHEDYDFNRSRYKERLAKFVSGVANIHVGGDTQTEIWERKMRLEDAVHAASAAMEGGIVPGGGIALLDLVPEIKSYAETLNGDEKTGANTLVNALLSPVKQIADNAGFDGAAVAARLLQEPKGKGMDVETGAICDMRGAGIIDPLKVTCAALESAASIASVILTVEVGVAEQ